jgi:hypothetical protein
MSDSSYYTCYRTPLPVTIDGDLDKPVWRHARKSPRFVDMISGAPGFLNTQAAALWHIFFGRFGKLKIGNSVAGNSMSWDPVGDHDNHLPERFTRVVFSMQNTIV